VSLLRSILFVPGTRVDRFARALASGADAVVFDLEDGVDSSRKLEARAAVHAFLAGSPEGAARRFVRINRPGTPWHDDDVAMVKADGVDGVVLPKSESPEEVETVARHVKPREVFPLLETANGILRAQAIAGAGDAVAAILFGAEDLTAQIGIPRTVDGDELIFARSQVVIAATAAGIDAIDAVLIDITAADALRRDAARARSLGFRGKMAIHPDQVPVINEVFTPTAAELERARRIVEAFDDAQTRGESVIRLDDRMIDAPVVARARRLLGS
jgi:citrate lyase subunit beta/citryl-CoA lyase